MHCILGLKGHCLDYWLQWVTYARMWVLFCNFPCSMIKDYCWIITWPNKIQTLKDPFGYTMVFPFTCGADIHSYAFMVHLYSSNRKLSAVIPRLLIIFRKNLLYALTLHNFMIELYILEQYLWHLIFSQFFCTNSSILANTQLLYFTSLFGSQVFHLYWLTVVRNTVQTL